MSEVKLYTTPDCPYCKKVKELLDKESIAFQEHNVAEEKEKAKEMIQKSGQQGVPVTVIGEGEDEEVIVGYKEDKLREKIGN